MNIRNEATQTYMAQVELDELELLYIDDSLGCLRPNPFSDFDDQLVSLRDLIPGAKAVAFPETILKIGGALLEITESDEKNSVKSVLIDFNEDELWMLRELADSNIRTKDRAVGYKLKLKIHKALQQTIANEALNDEGLASSLDNTEVETMSPKDIQNLMEKFLENDDQNARAN